MTDVVIAQTTIDDEDQAKALARGAVESKLAAGAHIDAPLTAVYWWKSEIETAGEWRISYMTTADRLPKLGVGVREALVRGTAVGHSSCDRRIGC